MGLRLFVHMSFRLLLLACLILSTGSTASADGPSAGGAVVTMEDAVRLALHHHPGLIAARFEIERARARLLAAGRWPNPELQFEGLSDFALTGNGEGAFSVGFYQEFPLTARLTLERIIGQLDVARALREIRNAERLLIAEVQRQCIAVAAARQRAETWRAIEGRLTELLEAAQRRIAAGQGGLAEKSLSLASLKQAWNARTAAETEARIALLDLRRLLGLRPDHPLALSDSLPEMLSSLRSLAGARPDAMRRPDAELLLLDAERARTGLDLARAEIWEGIRFGIQYTHDRGVDAPNGLGTDEFLGITISLPLPVWDRKEGAIAEQSVLRDQTAARIESLQIEMATALATELQKIDLLEARATIFLREAITPLEEAESELRAAFDQGRVEMRDLLELRARTAELHLERTSIDAALASAYAELIAITGAHPAVSRPYLQSPAATSAK